MTQSIRLRLVFFIGSLMLLAWGGITASSIYSARKEVRELFDAQLAQSARVLHALIQREMEEALVEGKNESVIVLDVSAPGRFYESKISFMVRDKDGKAWFMSQQAPDLDITEDTTGFIDVTAVDGKWRVFMMRDRAIGFTIEVAQNYHIRKELIMEITRQVFWPFIIVLPLLMLMIWIGASRSLRPLEAIADEVRHRNPQNLEQIDVARVPAEVLPLFASLNTLLSRLQKAISNERGFTSDAAHELRTPLAGIKAQAQVALRASDEKEKDAAIRHIIIGIDNTTHLVRQMLMLARLDPDIPNRKFIEQDLMRILTEVAADVASLAMEKHVDLEVLQATGETKIEGQAEALSVLVRNLIDNAVRYTPAGGWVKAGISRTPDGVVLKIMDSGPGIAEEDKDRVFDRFYRGLGTGQTGSGLGLSIVQRVVDLHNATIEFQTGMGEGKGVIVEVTFPSK
ncbi:MAG: two-component sensor histidine kinase [bacterium]|nr:MAG: two-component sensor histidine kinase [bacterium]